jgi:hypothetical protein
MSTYRGSLSNLHVVCRLQVRILFESPSLNFKPNRYLELNYLLDEFYNTHAQKESAEKWFDAHPYQEAIADDADAVWMAK